jgi:hypothetical protein
VVYLCTSLRTKERLKGALLKGFLGERISLETIVRKESYSRGNAGFPLERARARPAS